MMKMDYLLDVHVFLLLSHAAAGLRTVGNIAVQAGANVTVPCFYDEEYRYYVKYWCKGENWSSCKTIARSDSSQENAAVSLIDDPVNQVFTVTMSNLHTEDSDTYRCIVEIEYAGDYGKKLYLNITAGVPALSVVHSRISGEERGTVVVTCLYKKSLWTNEETKWCADQRVCKTANEHSDSQNPSLQISDNGMGVFNVMMSRLEMKDSGWNWCSYQDLNIPVYISVSKTTTGTGLMPNEPNQTPSSTNFPQKDMTYSPESKKDKGIISETLIAVAVLALFLLVLFCVVRWKLKNRQEEIQVLLRQRQEGGHVLPQETCQPEWEVLYTTADYTQKKRTESTDQDIYNNVTRPETSEAVQELVYSVVMPHTENE